MRIAFHAPLKPPDHPVPSGDRLVARLLMAALTRGGHSVELASRLRTWNGAGDAARQARIREIGARMATRLVRRYRAAPPEARPQAWFTYHLYHKAPDWLGPAVADALNIPYVIAEASVANKQANGSWRMGHEAAIKAVARADAIISLNEADEGGLRPWVTDDSRLHRLAPFLDPAPFAAAQAARAGHRAALARDHGLDPARPWLATVAMMRPGDKLRSYKLLADALRRVNDRPWQLVVAGDGPARPEVEAVLSTLGHDRVRFAGRLDEAALPGFYAAADLYVWPAVREAFGMAFLEAQASDCPVVAGAEGGVPGIVHDGETGVLTAPGDTAEFARAVARMLDDENLRRHMGANAMRRVMADHSIDGAARALGAILARVTRGAA
ncbi:MAG: glycosyltransferase family 4 protein [Alphaproteobacteria bacterium]|nr:glycosyltransferase family 4 protein [Alphaproteobacteria bacterium]